MTKLGNDVSTPSKSQLWHSASTAASGHEIPRKWKTWPRPPELRRCCGCWEERLTRHQLGKEKPPGVTVPRQPEPSAELTSQDREHKAGIPVFVCSATGVSQCDLQHHAVGGPPKELRAHLQNPTVQIPTVYSVSDPMSFSDASAMD